MTSIAVGAIVVITAITAYIFGFSAGAKPPMKRTVEGMNRDEARRQHYRASLIAIRNHFAGQKSGAAKLAARMAKEALK